MKPSLCGLVLVVALGTACAVEGEDPCEGVDCSARGFCVADQDNAYCACLRGYHPRLLACVSNVAADPCDGIDCSGRGTCRVEAAAPTCDCTAGYRHLVSGEVDCFAVACDLLCVAVEPALDGGGDDAGPDDAGDADAVDVPSEDAAPDEATVPDEATTADEATTPDETPSPDEASPDDTEEDEEEDVPAEVPPTEDAGTESPAPDVVEVSETET
jgi:hypothetical protein